MKGAWLGATVAVLLVVAPILAWREGSLWTAIALAGLFLLGAGNAVKTSRLESTLRRLLNEQKIAREVALEVMKSRGVGR